MTEWVVLRPIFDICLIETGFKRGRRLQVLWWRQEVADNHLKVTVEAISEAARMRQQQESSRRGGSEGGSDGGDH